MDEQGQYALVVAVDVDCIQYRGEYTTKQSERIRFLVRRKETFGKKRKKNPKRKGMSPVGFVACSQNEEAISFSVVPQRRI